MSHGTATEWGKDGAASYKSRLGLWMFGVYTVVYFGFVVINTVNPKAMAIPFTGVNLAVAYGLGLIFFALILAFVYNALCTRAEAHMDRKIQEVGTWFDTLATQGKLPPGWDKQRALTFCEALIAVEAEISDGDGRNLTALEAFQRLFEGEVRK